MEIPLSIFFSFIFFSMRKQQCRCVESKKDYFRLLSLCTKGKEELCRLHPGKEERMSKTKISNSFFLFLFFLFIFHFFLLYLLSTRFSSPSPSTVSLNPFRFSLFLS